MDPIKRQPSRLEPVWRDGTPDWAALERTSRPSAPSSRPQPGPVMIPSTLPLPHPALQKGQIEIRLFSRSLKPRAILIRQAIAGNNQPNITPQLSRSGGVLLWEEQLFLVREPVELSISHILASRCTITGGEIAAIAALFGRFSEGFNTRAVTGEHSLPLVPILFYSRNSVRSGSVSRYLSITGGPHEHEILIVDHVVAFAEVVERLTMKNPSQYPWTAELNDLPKELKKCDSPEKLLRSKLFDQLGDEGKLKMLVNAANKTAYHNLESYKRIWTW
ncbi:hypothetical protein N7505_001302 [Penicillium chrysogenum]|uniref:Uncharacterized protein n=1 Tax=Penicillium chrysogenum TaxID=5076 RepID=A0ABQ8WWT9_PENCH|nr:hypothetical protein N7505_001302 [Penicillium chrysogenum]